MFAGRFRLSGNNLFARSLITIQFGVSVFLAILTLTMYDQLSYVNNKDLGIDAERIMVVPVGPESASPMQRAAFYRKLKNDLQQEKSVLSVSGAESRFTEFTAEGIFDKDGNAVTILTNAVDLNYTGALGMTLTKGRDLSGVNPADRGRLVIINEAAARKFGVPDPIGRSLSELMGVNEMDMTVVGIVKDFHYMSLQERIQPAYLTVPEEDDFHFMYIKTAPGKTAEAISVIKRKYLSFSPDRGFSYFFLDDEINSLYNSSEKWRRIIKYASVFALSIACMGLLGLSLLTVLRRAKEISIRRVLGAGGIDIVRNINREFTLLVIFSNVIAWPAAWYAAGRWLNNFAYKTNIELGNFLLAGIGAFLIAVLTVSSQAFRAVRANPADTQYRE